MHFHKGYLISSLQAAGDEAHYSEEENKIWEAKYSYYHTRATSGEYKEQHRKMSHTGLIQNIHNNNSY